MLSTVKPIKKAYIRKVYDGHGKMLSLPKSIAQKLELEGENEYLQLYFDEINKTLLVKRVPTDLEDI